MTKNHKTRNRKPYTLCLIIGILCGMLIPVPAAGMLSAAVAMALPSACNVIAAACIATACMAYMRHIRKKVCP